MGFTFSPHLQFWKMYSNQTDGEGWADPSQLLWTFSFSSSRDSPTWVCHSACRLFFHRLDLNELVVFPEPLRLYEPVYLFINSMYCLLAHAVPHHFQQMHVYYVCYFSEYFSYTSTSSLKFLFYSVYPSVCHKHTARLKFAEKK